MKNFPNKSLALCMLLYLTWGLLPTAGEPKENFAKTGAIGSVSCVIFTIQSTAHEANEIRKPAGEDFFPEIQKLMEKTKVEKKALIFRSPRFQNGNYHFIVRVGKRRENDPIIGKMSGVILRYSENNAIRLKSIEYLTE